MVSTTSENQQQQQQQQQQQRDDALPFHFQSAAALASKIRRGEVSSLELTKHFIQRIEELDLKDNQKKAGNGGDNDTTTSTTTTNNNNNSINAVVVRCFEAALERAKELDRILLLSLQDDNGDDTDTDRDRDPNRSVVGPLHGVPITVKENNDVCNLPTTVGDPTRRNKAVPIGPLHGVPITIKENFDVCNLPTTLGNPTRNFLATRNSPAVQRLVDAGAVVLGKTNVPIGCNDVQTYNSIWGSTSNPHECTRTAGGSSGGSAAAICAGFAALELGGDIGGSIRLPAALCGVFGHKSTLGSVPTAWGPSRTQDIVVKGPIARTAEDLELAMRVLVGVEGPAKRAWKLSLPPSEKKLLKEFRVAIWNIDGDNDNDNDNDGDSDNDVGCCPVDSDVKAVVREVRDKLCVLGCRSLENDHPFKTKYGWEGGSARAFDVYKCLLATEENLELEENEVEIVRNLLFQKEQQKKERKEENSNSSNDDGDGEYQEQQQLRQQAKWITQSTQGWHRANMARQEMRAVYERFFETYDVLICPITVCAAWKKDESGSGSHEWTNANKRVRLPSDTRTTRADNNDNNIKEEEYVQHFWQIGKRILLGADGFELPYHDQVFWSGVTNICGNPSTVFPAGRAKGAAAAAESNHKDDLQLPIGLQVVGAEWNDLTTIAFVKALEKEAGYAFVPPKGY